MTPLVLVVCLATVPAAASDASDVEPAVAAADAGVISEPSPSPPPRGSFAVKARLARHDAGAGERVCRGETRPLHRPRSVAVPCEQRPDDAASGLCLAVVPPVVANASDVEPAVDAADASVILEPSPIKPRGSFAVRARLARLDAGAGERGSRGEARPFRRPRIVAVPCDQRPDDAASGLCRPAQVLADVPSAGAAAAPVARRQAWPRVIDRAPVALPVPNSWQDRLLQEQALQDQVLQDLALQNLALQDLALQGLALQGLALHDPVLPQQARPDPAALPAVTELDRQSQPVDEYLCRVYWRMPHKVDDAGDFSWKDGVAAAMAERTVCDYAINGMHPDLREALYVLGRKADAAGINWSLLSGFRDDFRQRIASGFKAKDCESWHGGSCRTNGWGDGRAADLWMADQDGYPVKDASRLLALVDQMAPALGLTRPMRWSDPPHVQLSGEWQEIASTLREQRLRNPPEASERSAANR